jgi:hypothetical protein
MGTLTYSYSDFTPYTKISSTEVNSKFTSIKTLVNGNLENTNIAASAAIARSKLANGTADHVIINNGTGGFSSEAQLSGTRGGTGVSNAGTLTYGANNITFTTSGVTSLTLPTTGTLLSNSVQATVDNKLYNDNTCFWVDSGDSTKKLAFECSGITTATTRTLTVPDANTTIVGTDATQTLTNKSLSDSTCLFVDNSDATKKLAFELSSITTGTTRTVTIPDANLTMVGIATSQTLTNKTIALGSNTVTSTASRMLVVDASGNVGVDSAITWDATNKAVDVRGSSANATVYPYYVTNSASMSGASQTQGVGISIEPTDNNTRRAEIIAYNITNGSSVVTNQISLAFLISDADVPAERVRFDYKGNVLVGTSTTPSSATKGLVLSNGTLGADTADMIQLYSSDLSAGNTVLTMRTEGSGVTGAGITNTTVTHKVAIKVNGTTYYLLATTNAT